MYNKKQESKKDFWFEFKIIWIVSYFRWERQIILQINDDFARLELFWARRIASVHATPKNRSAHQKLLDGVQFGGAAGALTSKRERSCTLPSSGPFLLDPSKILLALRLTLVYIFQEKSDKRINFLENISCINFIRVKKKKKHKKSF